MGIDWQSADDRIQLTATVFQQDTENMIDFDFGIGGYLNIEEVENLFDEEYQQILGYGTPDLSGYLGIRLRY